MKATIKELEIFGAIGPEVQGVYFALLAGMCGLMNEKPGSRERVIDFLLSCKANLSPEKRESPYGLFLGLMIAHLESTQF